ncbi:MULTISPECIES: phage tail protein [Streptomyces]|uniref:phage tail protein n=1 Tax=Streptomyces TaxID=1883 RepID=UPI001F5FCE23|nr:phage tail protein [Streptomyces sp. GB4-14]
MRGSLDGLGSSAPIGAMLPAIFADDDLAQRFVAGLDEVLAPLLVVLDNLDAYFDPALAPLDFTRWLADWVGAETEGIDPGADAAGGGVGAGAVPASTEAGGIGAGSGPASAAGAGRAGALPAELRLRAAVAAAARLHRVRGTRRGLSEAVRLVFGVPPEIRESGAAAWHARPLGPVPGDRRPHLHVTLRLPDPSPADHHRLDTLVAAARPAHMPYTVEVIASAVAERTTDR